MPERGAPAFFVPAITQQSRLETHFALRIASVSRLVPASVGRRFLSMSALSTVLAKLRVREADLRRHGVVHVAVFGSVAMDEDRPDSDVDLFVDLAPEVADDFLAYAGIAADLEEIVGRDVDVARHDRLRPHVRPTAERQAVYAF